MTSRGSAGSRLRRVFDDVGRLCVGIDPHPYLLEEWSLPDTAAGARQFGLRVVDAARGSAGIVKPQVAFFERFGSRGYAALEDVMAAARDAGLFVIGDAKRGDVGSTARGYAAAWLSPGSPLEADAMTASPYLGFGSLDPVIKAASAADKCVFVLCATSNPESGEVQLARRAEGESVAAHIVDCAVEADRARPDDGVVGLVLGATRSLGDYGIDAARASDVMVPVLAPGFGHQGARVSDAAATFGRFAPGVIVSESRSLLSVGPADLTRAVRERSEEVKDAFGGK